MKTPNSSLQFCEKVFIAVSHNHQNYAGYVRLFSQMVTSNGNFHLNFVSIPYFLPKKKNGSI